MSKIEGFAYSTLDQSLRAPVRKSTTTIKGLLEKSSSAMVLIGKELLEVRSVLTAAQWRDWLTAEFRWSQSTASQYMSASKRFFELDCLHYIQPYALFQLARKATPEAAVTEAIELARTQTLVTGKVAKELIHKHGGQPTRVDAGQPRKEAPSPAPAETMAVLHRSIAAFSEGVTTFVGAMTWDQREALADKFERLARELRKQAAPAAPKRRKHAAAAA